MGGLGQLGILFLSRFSDKQPGPRQQIVNGCDHGKKEQEYTKEKIGAIERTGHEYQCDHQEIHRYQGQCDRPVRKTTIQQKVMDMIPVGTKW